ncbi:MAG: AMP-binding protein [Bacteroidales bacterium]|nr:AMP-binding protein [Bacteroidales bacterium]
MNAFDFFFENTATNKNLFLVGKEELPFNELYLKSVALAGFIKERVGDRKNIILISPNNAFFLTAYFAIIKSGNTCIPLDPAIEEEKFKYIADITSAEILFCADQVKNRLAPSVPACFTPGDVSEINHNDVVFKAEENFDRERCAEIIFTSGSTGAPKGVMLSHKNLVANTVSIISYLGLNETDRMLVVLPFYYCYGLSLLHTHLRVGGSIVLNNSFIFLGSVLNDLINHKCTGFAGVPSHFQILLRKSDSFKKTHFPHLKYVTQAGGKLAPVFIDEFRESKPEVKFIVMYGQTEATARLSYLPAGLYEQKKGSMGKGIPGVTLRVVDENNNDITPGETGEVIARGDNVMLGYFKDEAGTSETIRNGWLHTGDLGTVDTEGYIFLTARKKEIIKVGGKRISPKEIEAVIFSIPEVVDCTIEGIDDDILGEALKATVVVNNCKNISEEQIKQHCAKNLALYKIPQVFDIKEQINMSATGKKIKKLVN